MLNDPEMFTEATITLLPPDDGDLSEKDSADEENRVSLSIPEPNFGKS